MEEIGIDIGPMNVRLENIHANTSPANYVSFLQESHRSGNRSDRDSIHSVSSMRSVMSGMSSLWSGFGLRSTNNVAKTEKAKAQFVTDLKYLYSAFTKIPCLRLSPDHNAHLISGYEEFPFDTAVPLLAFKNVSSLEVSDVDFRQFYGWDRLADQLRSLTVKRAHLNDLSELLTSIVLDDMDKRRRRSSRSHMSAPLLWPGNPSSRVNEASRTLSHPGSPTVEDKMGHSTSPKNNLQMLDGIGHRRSPTKPRNKSSSPTRPGSSSRSETTTRYLRGAPQRVKRSGSASSNSSSHSSEHYRSGSSSNFLSLNRLPVSKWLQLRHLSVADNSLTSISTSCLAPLVGTLTSLDLSSNLFTEIPEAVASLSMLKAFNMSNCMLENLHTLVAKPFPAITVLSLRANRLISLGGIELLGSLERFDVRDNKITDPFEFARLTGNIGFRELWVARNPFANKYGPYRIMIFNLFRNASGFAEDVIIDSSGPGYHEKRHLRERITEGYSDLLAAQRQAPPAHVTSGSAQQGDRSMLDPTPIASHNPVSSSDRPEQYCSASPQEVMVGTGRRKKGLRRRIVDLAHEPISPVDPTSNPSRTLHEARSDRPSGAHNESSGAQEDGASSSPAANAGTSPRRPSQSSPTRSSAHGQSLATEIQHQNSDGEMYRQKIEALKREVGSNWLSVLTESQTQNGRAPAIPPTSFPPHDGIPMAMSNGTSS